MAPLGIIAAITLGSVLLVFSLTYLHFSRITDERLRAGPFAGSANIFASPHILRPGDRVALESLTTELNRGGYTAGSGIGRYEVQSDGLAVHPGPESYFAQLPALIQLRDGKVSRILSLPDRKALEYYQLEPQLITNLSAENFEKRRLIKFAELPKHLINAVVAVEDKRFFQHPGIDVIRLLKAAYVDLREGRKEQGASTLSMQLSRNLWLEPDKRWRRKLSEIFISLNLERKLSKQQILEYYCNQVYLGRRGPFNIHGFGAGAWAYFGKDVRDLTVAEAATLAGMVQRPGYYNPFRNAQRLRERRNLVLSLMRDNDLLAEEQYQRATQAALSVNPGGTESTEASYYVDLVNDEIEERMPQKVAATSVYTTIDLTLQHAAVEAVRIGIAQVDKLLVKRKKRQPDQPQVALIALDPHTGEVKALVGGRSYVKSQLNHTLARRPPGSAFKPFVYAAALNTALRGGPRVFTPASLVVDEPTTFQFGRDVYEPGNFKGAFYGPITLRRALAKSLNIATVKVAEAVGYGAVVALARQAGLNDGILATPAVALGSYVATPLEIAGAYTIFANQGIYVKPTFIKSVRGRDGTLVYSHQAQTRSALHPAVAYLMVNMLEEVMRSGTAAGVRGRGFQEPAAGKTGTSRDGWFAGFTSDLLCIVWVGFDDYSDLGLEGSKSALPIWTEFMKRAVAYQGRPKPFKPSGGVTSVRICSDSGELALDYCPSPRQEFFISGTEPASSCNVHGSFAFLGSQPQTDENGRFALPVRSPRSAVTTPETEPGQERLPVRSPRTLPPDPRLPARSSQVEPETPAPAAPPLPARTPSSPPIPARSPELPPRTPRP
jgi:penicillin-binding protein 1B